MRHHKHHMVVRIVGTDAINWDTSTVPTEARDQAMVVRNKCNHPSRNVFIGRTQDSAKEKDNKTTKHKFRNDAYLCVVLRSIQGIKSLFPCGMLRRGSVDTICDLDFGVIFGHHVPWLQDACTYVTGNRSLVQNYAVSFIWSYPVRPMEVCRILTHSQLFLFQRTLSCISLLWISAFVTMMRVCLEPSEVNTQQMDNEKARREFIRRTVMSKDITKGDRNHDDCCAICLGDYKDGEKLCWSPNTKCPHSFHLSCAEEWLFRQPKCPCCRSNYLLNDEAKAKSTTVLRRSPNLPTKER